VGFKCNGIGFLDHERPSAIYMKLPKDKPLCPRCFSLPALNERQVIEMPDDSNDCVDQLFFRRRITK